MSTPCIDGGGGSGLRGGVSSGRREGSITITTRDGTGDVGRGFEIRMGRACACRDRRVLRIRTRMWISGVVVCCGITMW